LSVPAVQVPVACAKIFWLAKLTLNITSAIFKCLICIIYVSLIVSLVRTSIYDFGSFIFFNPEDAYKAEIVVTQVPKLGDRTFISFL
jgi:hypothetical protein